VKQIHCLQHVPYEPAARIGDWAASRGVAVLPVRLFDGEALPPATEVDALLIMGGPMGVHDATRYDWLSAERRLVGDVIAAGRPVVGVCLGAQLVADALGARVYRNRFQEIGWHDIEATSVGREHALYPFPKETRVFQWHGDTFDLPAGASQLARSVACENQAFAWGERVLALQFHLEFADAEIGLLIDHGAGDLGTGPYIQSAEAMRAPDAPYAEAHALLERLLDRWKEQSHEDAT
jgi:GMP synthase-like glutamine amidotransferase